MLHGDHQPRELASGYCPFLPEIFLGKDNPTSMELLDIKHIGVVGAGLMGHGIAQVFAAAGYPVNIYDVDPVTLASVKDRIAANFKVFIELNLAKPEDIDGCLDRVTPCPTIESLCEGPQYFILGDWDNQTIEIAINEILGSLHVLYKEMLGCHFQNCFDNVFTVAASSKHAAHSALE